MKSKWIKLIVGLVLLGIMMYAGSHYFDYRRLEELWDASATGVIAITFVYLITRLLNGEILRLTAASLDTHISLSEAFFIVMVMSYQNLLIPKTGLSAPALYLKYKHGVKFSEFSSFLLPMSVLQLLALGAIGLGTQIYLHVVVGVPMHTGLAAFLAAMTGGSVALLFIPVRLPESWHGRLWDFLRRFCHSWERLRGHHGLLAKVTILQVLVIALRAVRIQIAFSSLGTPVTLPIAIIVSVLGQVGLWIGITPGALGFREGAMTYACHLMRISRTVALNMAILDRAVTTACIIIIGQPALWFIFRRKSKTPVDPS